MLDLSKHRLAVRKRTERKTCLEYTERRLVRPADVDIPGRTDGTRDDEPNAPETPGVHG